MPAAAIRLATILIWPLLINPAAYRSLSVGANTRNGALVSEPGARAIRRCSPTPSRPEQTCSPLVSYLAIGVTSAAPPRVSLSKLAWGPRCYPSHRQRPVPICGRPRACKIWRTVLIGSLAAICPACWMRSPVTAGRDGFRDASSGHGGGIGRPLGTADCLASGIDRSHHLLLLEQA
jgi:hypothetical protein